MRPGSSRSCPDRRPQIELELAGRSLRFLVDTGASTPFTVQDLDRLAPRGPRPIVGIRRGVDGDIMSRAARLDITIELGPMRFERPIVHGARSGNKVGGRAFADARISFDQHRRVLLVEPARDEPIRTPPIHHLDVVFEKLPDAWIPARTLSGASLGAVGLRDEDRVIAVDGVPVADLVCEPLGVILEGRTHVRLTLLRDEARVERTLAVHRRLADDH